MNWSDVASLSLIIQVSPQELGGDYGGLLERLAGRPLDFERHHVSNSMLMSLVAMGLGNAITLASATSPIPKLVVRPIEGESAIVTIEASWLRANRNLLRQQLLNFIRRAA